MLSPSLRNVLFYCKDRHFSLRLSSLLFLSANIFITNKEQTWFIQLPDRKSVILRYKAQFAQSANHFFQVRGGAEIQRFCPFGDAFDHAGKRLTRADFEKERDSGANHIIDGARPLYGSCDLLSEFFADLGRARNRARVNIADKRDGGIANRSCIYRLCQTCGGGLHDGEWNAPLTARGMTRFAPRSFASSIARFKACCSPEMTICPGALKLATVTLPCPRCASAGRLALASAVASRQTSCNASSSMPMMAAMPPRQTVPS